MVTYKQASTDTELEQILLLQQQNLPKNLTHKEIDSEGFVTVQHSLEILKEMNDEHGHIIAIENDIVIGYALCMHPKFANTINILKPMFKEISKTIEIKTKYMVMGQICIAKPYRRQGIFKGLYSKMKRTLPKDLDCIITEVDASNQRSLHAHKAIGFTELKRYKTTTKEWSLIVLK
ncbi:GNAT family N-acetyltransferase [Flagellimonas sp. HMM57]|uniref:GNAT family N-acetyltransferase n=1 Tax=unclassified Flagellimonas TaxID=2644544 RepID=UPI0013D531E8|nr:MULTISPECIES: GNAT family N-acetyltransferase [unclassified Flagellimonas]UII74479.1 GNAT family N-acetyltransferase [Flagellimonas sp. HMM57]